ncbi:hypothetical protein BVG19_g4210 [[Candida] boidinii]|nr:hypothetical protein BVG19_g4210 [[Candida] boidinii]OWB53084.1 hypothetical protein B5S27_g4672 [[Candida] boidinii]
MPDKKETGDKGADLYPSNTQPENDTMVNSSSTLDTSSEALPSQSHSSTVAHSESVNTNDDLEDSASERTIETTTTSNSGNGANNLVTRTSTSNNNINSNTHLSSSNKQHLKQFPSQIPNQQRSPSLNPVNSRHVSLSTLETNQRQLSNQNHSPDSSVYNNDSPIQQNFQQSIPQRPPGPKKQQSTKSMRSQPLPPTHSLAVSNHLPGSASHHRQYVLLSNRNSSTSNLSSPKLQPTTGVSTSNNNNNSNNSTPNNNNNSSSASNYNINSTNNINSPTLSSVNTNNQNSSGAKKTFTILKKPSKYIFSVDDDEDEVEEDLNREYLEGYNDALRNRYQKLSKVANSAVTSNDDYHKKNEQLEHEIANNLLLTAKDLNSLKEKENDSIHRVTSKLEMLANQNEEQEEIGLTNDRFNNTIIKPSQGAIAGEASIVPVHPVPGFGGQQNLSQSGSRHGSIIDNEGTNISLHHQMSSATVLVKNHDINDMSLDGEIAGEIDDTFNVNDQNHMNRNMADDAEELPDDASISSIESFTLRERQDAINETHPFGIRIWKPAIYKKKRSVEIEANDDIHSTLLSARKVSLGVGICNLAWSCTFGLLLFLLCLTLSFIVGTVSLFTNRRKNDSFKYSKIYFSLGFYLLSPFGKIVLLKRDKRYIYEDAGVGSSLAEFRRWRTEEEGRLFYESGYNHGSAHSEQQHQQPSIPHSVRGESKAVTNLTNTTGNTSGGRYSDNGEILVDSIVNNQNNNTTEGTYNDYETEGVNEDDDDDDDEGVTFYKQRWFGRGDWNIGRVVFYAFYYIVVQPLMQILGLSLWLFVFTIPMAKVLFILGSHLRRHPLGLSFEVEKDYNNRRLGQTHSNESILICTYRSFGLHYYKYTVDGTNIFFINLLFLVLFVCFDFYVIKEYFEIKSFITDPSVIFVLCLIAIIPLAYYIGQAVASISAQTSMGVGAVINAFFSTIVEVFLYCVALDQSKGKIVEGSIIGSILAGVLLLPGLSMCGGAVRRKTQRYNPASAGVSSTMLLYSILVMLSPTILYEIYGQYEVQCFACKPTSGQDLVTFDYMNSHGVGSQTLMKGDDCKKCHFFQPSLAVDKLYTEYLRPYTIYCSVVLFLAYCIGLLFTLKTHAALIWSTPVSSEKKAETQQQQLPQEQQQQPSVSTMGNITPNNMLSSTVATTPEGREYSVSGYAASSKSVAPGDQLTKKRIGKQPQIQNSQQTQNQQAQPQVEESGGHDAPNWSRTKSTTILLMATLFYAIIAEILVDVVDAVLVVFSISPKFLGLTIFALVPNTTEFVNAISFAMHGNVALSMEIGSAYALQVCLLQIPVVVVYSCYKNSGFTIQDISSMFPLIFPRWDFIACLISVYMFTYIYAEGKSNYFKGSILILLYLSVLTGFYYSIEIDTNGLSMLKSITTAQYYGFDN